VVPAKRVLKKEDCQGKCWKGKKEVESKTTTREKRREFSHNGFQSKNKAREVIKGTGEGNTLF